ncbi:ATP-dependent DNA helicase PIF1 [Holothuria leucospilota]|uniref:ATP-dependent DNA helicase n=1 Tax=Holothuria leucospilota TaxID=206669 RepID=A0A9Q1BI10_HOLLE|nr:ATP-dependent DNA helicase PIF1 [Holothuria leucospilota]
MKTIRSNEEYKKKETQANLRRMKSLRSNNEYKNRELEINRKRIKTLRSNKNFSFLERKSNQERMQSLRAKVSYSEQETRSNLQRIQRLRKDESFTFHERQQNLKRIRMLRTKKYGLSYQQRNKIRMQILRKNILFKAKEKKGNKRQMQKLRKNVQFGQKEASQKRKNRASHNTKSFRDLQHKFWQSVSVGPEYVCCSCEQLWYRDSVLSAKVLQQKMSESYSWLLKEKDQWICRTCNLYVTSGKVPPLGRDNNMALLDVPDELNLHSLEERLVSLRTPFMQIRELPRGRQLSLKGNVVNVPADVSTTVRTLPRRMDNTQTIPVKFKRRLAFKHSVQSQNVRPSKVVDAAIWLVNNSELYTDEGVTIEKSWSKNLKNVENDWKEFLDPVAKEITHTSSSNTSERDTHQQEVDQLEMTPDSDDEWTEVQDEDSNPAGSLDTMLAPQFDDDSSLAYCFAPSEGNVPLGLFQDLHAEELAFPTLFCGKPRNKTKTRVRYSSICKWELRHKDRRFARSVANIFYKAKKLQINQIQQKATLSLRKKKIGDKKLTAGTFKNMERVQEILSLDEGFRVFRTVRGSPPYWEKTKKELFAMIRQLGIPTWFMSFSGAETRWLHLLRILGRTVHNKEYSDAEMLNMTWHEKSELIQSDPVTCARHFDYMIRRFINDVLLSSYHPVGEIVDHFYRVEFQQRGSPHIHMLAWVSNAPVYGNASNSETASFIDKYVTCQKPPASEHLSLNLQKHSHAKTCRKKRQGVCRFGFPIPPMPKTMILTPLENVTSDEKDKLSALYDKVKAYLNDLKLADDVTTSFQEMLDSLDTTEEQYIQAIRSTLTSDKVFLKRSPSEIRINAYSSPLLETWKANMDIQFILDPYACAMYVVSYISKGQRGMSNLMQRATKEAREGNLDIKQRVRHIGNKFLNHVEISAQEAVYLILQMSLRKASRQFVFINTSPPEERTILLKPLDYIQQLPDGSTDIECMGLIKKYAARPKVLESYCLADFAAWFDVSTNKKKNESAMQDRNESGDDDEDELDIKEQDDNTTCYTVGALQYKKRTKAKVVRYVRFNKQNDLENYCREQLMLFHPWRNEFDLKGAFETFQEQYKLLETSLKEKEAFYNHNSEAIDQAIESLDTEDYDFIHGNIAPNTEHKEQLDRKEMEMADKEKSSESHELYDIGQDMGIAVNNANVEELQKPRLPETQYHELVNNLNVKQKEFFYHVLHWCKTKNQPFYTFLTGGAGVGKSQVVKALYNALLRYYSSVPGNNPDDTHILLMAPTGKAAYGIQGYTIHNALQIPANQGYDYKALTAERLNTLQAKYHNLKIIFIDEISMVGNKMLRFIDQRLQQIMGSKKVFGGVSIIAVGDLFQLKPVQDGWIFNDLNTDYGPLATNLWKELFTAFELTEIMRQKDDQRFAEMLNRLREGKQTEEDLMCLKTREVPPESIPSHATHLFQTNAKVNAHNEKMFSLLDITKVEVPSNDIITGDVSNTIKKKMISLIPHDSNKTMGLMNKLSLGIGQRVDLCINVSVDDGLINGASGIVKYIDRGQGQKIEVVWIQFDDHQIGKIFRDSRKELLHSDICPMWTPITRVARQFRIGRYKNAEIMRKQFPLRPAAAKTVHRCQGDTLKEVAIDMSGRAVQCHIHYVALSRVTSITGLYIYDLNPAKISVDVRVAEEMGQLRTVRSMKICAPCLPHIEGSTTIIHQNVRSLRKHLTDIKCDSAMLSADVLLFTECHLSENVSNRDVNINGYKVFLNFPSHASSMHSPYGTAIYTRNSIIIRKQESCNFNKVEISYVTIDTMSSTLQVVVIYRSKTISLQHFEDAIKYLFTSIDPSQPTVITAITNEQLAVLAKSPNVSLRQSAEQMLLDRILERKAFQQVIQGCRSKDENELFRACSVFCVVLKSVNFTVPLPFAEIVKLLTLCLQKSLDREKYFTSRSCDSIFDIKIQRMTLATVCDFLSDSVAKKDVLVQTCPEIIQVCLQLIRESKNKEVLRYSILLLFQISGLGTTKEVRQAGAIKVLADRIITFHGDNIMQRITIQTIVILIGSVDDLCTDELTSMSYLVKNFVTILKTREGAFKSFVMKIVGTLCERRETFLKEIMENKALLKAVGAALKDKNDLVVNYCLRLLKVLLQGGSTVMEKVLDIPENAILNGLQHIAKEKNLDNKLLMTELLADFIQTEKFVLRIVQNGGLEIVKALAADKGDADMGFFSSAMLIDMAMISDEVKMELAKMCILPVLINWITLPNKNDKVAVFAAKTLVMLHLIDGSVEVGAESDGKSFTITVGDVRLVEPLNAPIKFFRWNSLFSQELVPLPLEEGSLTAAGDEHVEFQVPGLEFLKMENAGEFVFICLKGKEGSRYFQGMISEKNPFGLQKYVKMKYDDEANSSIQISSTDVCVIIATVDEDGTLRSIQEEVGSPGAAVTSTIPYKFLVQQRTISLILPSILEPLALEDWQVGCPLKKKDLDVLNVFLCMEDYLNLLIYSNTTTPNLLTTLRIFTGDSESEMKVHQAVIDILVTVSTYESGRKHLLSLGTAQLLVKFITSLLNGYLQSTEVSSSPKSEVFDSDLVPIPPSVAAIISSLPPRPESRAEARRVRASDSGDTRTDSRNQISSLSSVSGLLPVISEGGSIHPEQGDVEHVRLSVSSLVEEVVLELNKDEKKKKDGKKETEGIGIGDDYNSFSFDGVRCKKWRGPVAEQTEDNSYGEVWKTGDIVTSLLDHYGNISYLLNDKNLGVAFPESNQPQSPDSAKNDQESKSAGETEVITSSERSTEEEKVDEEKHGEPRPANTDVSLSSTEEGTDATASDEGTNAAPAVGTPSLYFEVKVNPKIPRPLYIGFSTLDSSDQVALIIEEHHLVLPDLSVKPVPKGKIFVVGCGYVATTHHVYFTLDGKPIELFFDFANPAASVKPVMPCLSSSSINVNWGQRPFEYKMTKSEKSEKYNAISTCQKFLQLCQEISKDTPPS